MEASPSSFVLVVSAILLQSTGRSSSPTHGERDEPQRLTRGRNSTSPRLPHRLLTAFRHIRFRRDLTETSRPVLRRAGAIAKAYAEINGEPIEWNIIRERLSPAARQARDILPWKRLKRSWSLPRWNNLPSTRPEQVAAFLRKTAEFIRPTKRSGARFRTSSSNAANAAACLTDH